MDSVSGSEYGREALGKKSRESQGERLFVAVDLPEEVRKQLLTTAQSVDLKGARYSRPEQMHLTIRFLGKVQFEQKECLVQKLDAIRLSSFKLEIDALGVFPQKGVPGILWAGLKACEALGKVRESVESVVATCGFDSDNKPWHPHITLARLKERNYLTPEMLDAVGIDRMSLEFPVNEFYLYRSELRKSGAVYTILETFKLVDG